MQIAHPEWLQLETDNKKLYGYNQGWYQTSFRRTRGCGPTVAAMQLLYLNKRQAQPLPYQDHSIAAITKVLEEVWRYVTPGWLLGLNSTSKFCKGVEALVGHHGLSWRCRKLSVTACRSTRPALAQVVQFLEAGIAADCPVAFLNLHKGKATALDSWHWIVLVALEYDTGSNRYLATGYDTGRVITFDLGLWLETTRWGGGFVYVSV
jgi:hypothetical protein